MSIRNTIEVGDHLKVSRGFYTHHGIYVGSGLVVHFSGGLAPKDKLNAIIRRDDLREFSGGAQIQVVKHNTSLNGFQIAQRALSRIGDSGYDLFKNNCEHFANWCVAGRHSSGQVAFGLAAFLGLGALLISGLSSDDD